MTTQRNQIIPAVYLLLLKDNKVLLQRRYNTGFQDGNYTFVSGHVDKDESPTQAICREAKEEAGITVDIRDIQFEQVLYRRSFDPIKKDYNPSALERIDFFFSTEKWQGEPHVAEPDKCDDLRWFPIDKLPKNMFPIVRTFLKDFKKKIVYNESGYADL